MTIKSDFAGRHASKQVRPGAFSLAPLKSAKPDTYDAHSMLTGGGNRCDFFVLYECASSVTGMYAIETKTSTDKLSKIKKQLTAGANFLYKELNSGESFKFLPVVVAKGIRKNDRRAWKKARILFNGKPRPIRHVKKNDELQKIPARYQDKK